MDKARVVSSEEYFELTGPSNTADSAIYVSEARSFWSAARSEKEVTNWETYGSGHSYYWVDGFLANSLEHFMERMMENYPEDVVFLLFHPELFDGRYEECLELS